MSGNPEWGNGSEMECSTDLTRELVDILVKGLNELSTAGSTETACRLAGQACMALRHHDHVSARRLDALLHRLTPRLDW